MKRKLLLVLLMAALVATAAEALRYDVTCPNCFNNQTLVALSVRMSGSYRAEMVVNGTNIYGNVQRYIGNFRCSVCRKFKFDAPIAPDKFVPILPATPANDPARGTRKATGTSKASAPIVLVCPHECCADKPVMLVSPEYR